MALKDVILTLAIMLGAGLCSQLVAAALRLPQVVVLFGMGIALGPPGVDIVDVPLDSKAAQLLLTLGVSFILFHGGLKLSARVLRRVAISVALLAIPGVLITAAITGATAAVVFGVPLATGLVIGAALAPTDPAILITVLERLRLRPKVSQTIIAESALNDPTGAVLALVFAGVALGGGTSVTRPIVDFLVQVAISCALGAAFGALLAVAISSRRAGVWRESSAICVMALITTAYFSIDTAGGSGYLGAFLAGLIVGNMGLLRLPIDPRHEVQMRSFVAATADVVVMLVFIVLGANLPPWSSLGHDLPPAAAVLAVLVFLARPVTVLACLAFDRRARWTRQELLFLAWTRETGVLPAALAGVITSRHVPHAELVTTTVAFAIVATLSLQATTKPWLARRLGLLESTPQRGRGAVPDPEPATW